MILILFINDTHVLLGLGLMVLPMENDLLLITSTKRMEMNRNLTHKQPTVLSILKYKYCVGKSRDISRDNFFENVE